MKSDKSVGGEGRTSKSPHTMWRREWCTRALALRCVSIYGALGKGSDNRLISEMRKVSWFRFSARAWWWKYTWPPTRWGKRHRRCDKIGGFLIFFEELWFFVYNETQSLVFLRACKSGLVSQAQSESKCYFWFIWGKECLCKSWQCHGEASVWEASHFWRIVVLLVVGFIQ